MKCKHNRMWWLTNPGEVCDKCKKSEPFIEFVTNKPRDLAQPNDKPLLCDGWRDVNDKPSKFLTRCLVALTNGVDQWVCEAMYDCYIGEFRATVGQNTIESRDENGENGVWVYKWVAMPDPPAFA